MSKRRDNELWCPCGVTFARIRQNIKTPVGYEIKCGFCAHVLATRTKTGWKIGELLNREPAGWLTPYL